MTIWRVNNGSLLGGEVCSFWQVNHAYSVGARCCVTIAGSTTYRPYTFECTTGGTSGASQPAFATTVGNTVNDNGVIWTTRKCNDGNWDNASCCLTYVTNYIGLGASDKIYIHNTHAEAGGALNNITGNTLPAILPIICVDKAAADALSTGASLTSTANGFHYSGGIHFYGVKLVMAASYISLGYTMNSHITLEGNGTDVLAIATAGGYFVIGSTSYFTKIKIVNGNINLNEGAQRIRLSGAEFVWQKGVCTTPAAMAAVFYYAATPNCRISDVDFSSVTTGKIFPAAQATYQDAVLMERCKFPTDSGFAPVTGVPTVLGTGSLWFHGCTGANNDYAFAEYQYEGTVTHETTIVRSGGASDGVTPISHKMVSTANVVDNLYGLYGPRLGKWTNANTSKTFTIEGVYDSLTNLQNDEIWMEFEYPANNTDGLGGFARDKCAINSTPADKTASAVTWTTTGLTNPNRFKCQVTVTPGKPGPITARICLAKPSTTIYIDPVITES